VGYDPILTGVPIPNRDKAVLALEEGNAAGFVFSGEEPLGLVSVNLPLLKRLGIYEKCLVLAYRSRASNFSDWTQGSIDRLFLEADRDRLRMAGAAVPDQPVFHVYRGVAGHGRKRRKRGWSWTSSLDVACWFAVRFVESKPVVLEADVMNEEVLAYLPDRDEEEYLCCPEKPRPLKLLLTELNERAARHAQRKHEKKQLKLARLLAAKGHLTADES
jgi:hypothetical protein